MSLALSLERLADNTVYSDGGAVSIRWGQLLRSNAAVGDALAELSLKGSVVAISELGTLRSGVVPRANAFFIVRELAFDQIPARMRVTHADMKRIAVVVDGLDYVCRIEREYLKPILKGPESLENAFAVRRSALRLLDVRDSKEKLAEKSANGTLAYLKRGETVAYTNSNDPLKGGIPALRSQVKNRKPFWYSLQGVNLYQTPRIVLPEHHDRRYVFTKIEPDDTSVVIDTLYSFEPATAADVDLIHAGMNSLLGWYQVELRGRSQHGDGVLKVKLPDYRGVLLANPATIAEADRREVMKAFAELTGCGAGPSLEELGTAKRLAFDIAYLRACGFSDPQDMVVVLEQELRALSGERVERKLSVSDAKVSRRRTTSVAASVDAFASRIASGMLPFPDPRNFVDKADKLTFVQVLDAVDGPLTVGTGLFDLGDVLSGSTVVAKAASVAAGQLVRAVLLIDPEVSGVELPSGANLQQVHKDWSLAVKKWQEDFDRTAKKLLIGITDKRAREAIISKAMTLMHAK